MANNPYALGKLTSTGPVYTGEVHAAPHHDYPKTPQRVEDLRELLPSLLKYHNVNDALVYLHNCSLQAEVHHY